ncbi:MAG: hypothetical protein GY854_15440 [Deltaproteobacteria bacterium]|nr:hypothetical protein [Deltaproteobacteria bacterium]
MVLRKLSMLAVGILCLTCGITAKQNATQTLAGVSRQQALAAAEKALADEGFDVDELEPGAGFLATTWKESPRRSIRYEIVVEHAPQVAVDNPRAALTISIAANARDRNIDGWSPEYPVASKASNLLDDIIGLTTEETGQIRQRRSRPKCKRSDDCDEGRHCAAGFCLAECKADEGCGENERCDKKGRCIPVPRVPESLIEKPPHPPRPTESEIPGAPDAGTASGEVTK